MHALTTVLGSAAWKVKKEISEEQEKPKRRVQVNNKGGEKWIGPRD